jgi:probable rRNA maturation factor
VSLDLSTDIFIESPVPPEITEDRLVALLAFGLTAENAAGSWHVELVLGDDDLLRRLHREFMGLDSPTDIMTFPDHEPDADESGSGGQIYISVERAAEQAADYGQTVSDEIAFLVLHGVLHLCGWDDATDGDRAAMLDHQARVLGAFHQALAGGGGVG